MTGYRKRLGKQGRTYTMSYTQRKKFNQKMAKAKEDAKYGKENDLWIEKQRILKWAATQKKAQAIHPLTSNLSVSIRYDYDNGLDYAYGLGIYPK
uniref:Uncharacterized protein n=1 Tax=viral metagenome TaxID=1070528 RepID=A0A6M3JG17_9ZZZZ